jgi:hypothetical protein
VLTLALVLALGALTFALIGISLLLSSDDRYPSVTAHDHRKRRYRYCDECADDVVFAIEGAEVLP